MDFWTNWVILGKFGEKIIFMENQSPLQVHGWMGGREKVSRIAPDDGLLYKLADSKKKLEKNIFKKIKSPLDWHGDF